MYEIVIALYLLVSISIIGLVLIQHGKGADMGAAFGAGASATLFGSSGTGNFLTRSTTVLATVFFALSLILELEPMNFHRFFCFQANRVEEIHELSKACSNERNRVNSRFTRSR